jgi:hypothetical protein
MCSKDTTDQCSIGPPRHRIRREVGVSRLFRAEGLADQWDRRFRLSTVFFTIPRAFEQVCAAAMG